MNLLLIILYDYNVISFYFSSEEKNSLTNLSLEENASVSAAMIRLKIEEAWDEVDKQLWPLLAFLVGAFSGAFIGLRFQFLSLMVPIGIIAHMTLEVHLQRALNNSKARSEEYIKVNKEDVTQYSSILVDFEI